MLGGENGGGICSSSSSGDDDRFDFRKVDLRFVLDSLTGDDSPPDWKILLSSHPESSVPGPNWEYTVKSLRRRGTQ